MGLPIVQVDAFADRPFTGNPAVVCLLPEPRDAAWMQLVALEMNLSETAFLVRIEHGFELRWFTPTVEVDLCGHATLASAHVLWETGVLRSEERARFHTRSGLLVANRKGEWIELDFPATVPKPAQPPDGLFQALGVTPRFVNRAHGIFLVEVDDEETVRALTPNFAMLGAAVPGGAIVTGRSTSATYDFVSRVFLPGIGIDEDPVTGAAHCLLGPFWAERLGKRELVGYQASARGGVVRVRLDGNRALLGGLALTIMRGELADAAS